MATRLAPLTVLIIFVAACSKEPGSASDPQTYTADETSPGAGQGELPTGSSGEGAASCDDGSTCEACQDCALEGECAVILAQCQSSFACESLLSCLDACGPDLECAEGCRGSYPDGVEGVDAVASCVLCGPCQGACEAACDAVGSEKAR